MIINYWKQTDDIKKLINKEMNFLKNFYLQKNQ